MRKNKNSKSGRWRKLTKKKYKGKMAGRQRKVSAGIKEKVQDGERQEKENRRRRSDKKDAGKERAWE